MPQTAEEFAALLGPRLRQVLKACAPESNRGGWLDRLADTAGVSAKTVERYFYGDPSDAERDPSASTLFALCKALMAQNGPGAAQALFGDFLGVHIGAGESVAEQRCRAARAKVAEAEAILAGDTAVKFEGRVS